MLQDERFDIAYVDSGSAYRIAIYGVDVETIDAAVAMTLAEDSNTQVFIIKEIGKRKTPLEVLVRCSRHMTYNVCSIRIIVSYKASRYGIFQYAYVNKKIIGFLRVEKIFWVIIF
jgi:nucleoside-triphosphatase THEP1